MPQVQNTGSKVPVLAPNAGAQQSNQEIGILQAPAIVRRIKAIHSIQVATPDGKIAGARTPPSMGSQLAQPAERQRQERRQPVDLAAAAQRDPLLQAKAFSLARLHENA